MHYSLILLNVSNFLAGMNHTEEHRRGTLLPHAQLNYLGMKCHDVCSVILDGSAKKAQV